VTDNWPGHPCQISYTINRAGWDTTDGTVSTAEDLPQTSGTIPYTLYLTTSPYYALNPRYRFVPPGSTIEVTFELSNNTGNFILISNTDLEWENRTGRTGPKPQETQFLSVRFRQLFHNQHINEEPFNNSVFYDPIQLLPVYVRETKHDSLQDSIRFSLGIREGVNRDQQLRNLIGIGNNYDDAFPGRVWYEAEPEAKHFWNALYVNYMLLQSGIDALRTQSALDYATYGQEVDWRNWENVRKYDIVVFKFKEHSGGHVGFITEFDPATNKLSIVGGNQLNRVKESSYLVENADMYLLTIRRNWPDPGKDFGVIQE